MRRINLFVLILAIILMFTGASYADLGNNWTLKSPMPTARMLAEAQVVGGKIYVFGGQRGGSYLTTVERYDPAEDNWDTEFAPGVPFAPMPAAIVGFASVTIGHKIYVIGGWPLRSTVYVYDADENSWGQVRSLPAPDRVMRAAFLNGYIYVFGGAGSGGGNTPFYKIVYRYDPINDSWTTLTKMPSERASYAHGVLNGKVYIASGVSGPDGKDKTKSLIRCDNPEAGTYTELKTMPEFRNASSGEFVQSDFYVIAGNDSEGIPQKDVFIYSSPSGTWSTGPSLNHARWNPTSAVVDDIIYVFGGREDNRDLSEVEMLDIHSGPVSCTTEFKNAECFPSHPSKGVCQIVVSTPNGYGRASGFLIAPNLVLTTWHTFKNKGPTSVKEREENAGKSKCTFFYEYKECGSYDLDHIWNVEVDKVILHGSDFKKIVSFAGGEDFCIVLLKELAPENTQVYELSPRIIVKGEDIYEIGHPDDQSKQLACGSVTKVKTPAVGLFPNKFFYHNMLTPTGIPEEGLSGSPIFDKDHKVIGIAVGAISDTPVGLKIEKIYEKIKNYLPSVSGWLDICRVLGGIDFDNDGIIDNYVSPSSKDNGSPSTFYPLTVDFFSDDQQEKDFKIVVSNIPPGWFVESIADDGNPPFLHKDTFTVDNATPNSLYRTNWHIGCLRSAKNEVTIYFSLYENKLTGDVLIDTVYVKFAFPPSKAMPWIPVLLDD